VLEIAAREPRTLAIGLDAVAPAMAEASRRAVRPPGRGGLPNALFVVAAAESVPAELRGRADLVTVRFPWGSLLRGCLDADPAVADGLAALGAPGGDLELLLAPARRDGLAGLPTEPTEIVAAARRAFEPRGHLLIAAREATAADVAASGSTWAKRLLGGPAPDRRPVIVRFRRAVRTAEMGPSGRRFGERVAG
jgi:16S rRNA (adenine(1408)-N(1))-methyltransferase